MKNTKKYIALVLSMAILAGTYSHDVFAKQKQRKSIITKIKKSFGKLLTGEWGKLDGDDLMRIIGSSTLVYLTYCSMQSLFFGKVSQEQVPVSGNNTTNNSLKPNSVNFKNRWFQPAPVPPISQQLFDTDWVKHKNKKIRLHQLRVAGQRGHTCALQAFKNGILAANHFAQNNPDLEQNLIDNDLANNVIKDWKEYIIASAKLENAKRIVERATPVERKRLVVAQLVLQREKEFDSLKGNERDQVRKQIEAECEQAYENMSQKERAKIKIPRLALVREDGQGLNSNEIEDLIAIEQGNNTMVEHAIEPLLTNQECGFTVYEMTSQIGTDFDANINEIKNRLQQKEPYTHVFIINTANRTFDPTCYTHWISVVLHKDAQGNHEYCVMDSLSNSMLHYNGIWRLMSILEE